MKPQVILCAEALLAKSTLKRISDTYGVHLIRANDRKSFIEELKNEELSAAKVIYRPLDLMGRFGKFDREIIEAFPPSVKFITHKGAGYDQIDVAFAKDRGIKVSNTPGTVDSATADTAIFLMIGALRKFNVGLASLRKGSFANGYQMGQDPKGKVLGILGMGGIGTAIAKRAKSFDMEIIYHNRNRLSPEKESGAKYVSFGDFLRQSDVISLNLPLNDRTRHIISASEFDQMKDGVVIVNTARGPVLDEKALVSALESGKVSSCGLDVYENEPVVEKGLLENERCILLPHVATVSLETQRTGEELALQNALAALEGAELISPVAV